MLQIGGWSVIVFNEMLDLGTSSSVDMGQNSFFGFQRTFFLVWASLNWLWMRYMCSNLYLWVYMGKKSRLAYGRGRGLKSKLRTGTVYYRKIDSYPSIKQQIDIRWQDTIAFGASALPASMLYEFCMYDFCKEMDYHKDLLKVLGAIVYLELSTGLRFFNQSDIYKVSIFTSKHLLVLLLRFCVHHDLLLRVEKGFKGMASQNVEYLPNGKKKPLQYYFLTLKGQAILNEYHAYVQERYEQLKKIDINKP